MADELNYYELLELDPDEQDQNNIETRIREKQRQWSKQSTEGTPKDARLAARNLQLLTQIRTTLADPIQRQTHAKLAKQAREKRLTEARTRLSNMLHFAKGRVGNISAFINQDCARFVRELGRAEVERLVLASGLQATPPNTETKEPQRQALETTTARRIRDALNHINKRDLYEFLGLSQRCTAQTLHTRAEQLNRSLLRSGQHNDRTSAAKELAGQCLAIFSSEDGKRRYNTTLTDERLDSILFDVLPLAAKNGSINAKALNDMATLASTQGISQTETRSYIQAVAQRRRWTVQIDSTENIPRSPLPQCGFCGCLANDTQATYCWNCKEKLIIDCPACSARLPSNQAVCTQCAADVADIEVVEELFKKAEQAIETNPEQAVEYLEQCLKHWPNWEKAKTLHNTLLQTNHRQQTFSARLVPLLRNRQMHAAHECVTEAIQICGPEAFQRALNLITKALGDAREQLRESEQYRQQQQFREAESCLEKALEACTDLPEALQALQTLPPLPIKTLTTTYKEHNKTLHLAWTPPIANDALLYTLVRKADAIPQHVEDGLSLLQKSTQTDYEDSQAHGGMNWYYSLFAFRSDNINAQPSEPCSVGPLFLTPPPENIQSQTDETSCTLRWDTPKGTANIRVWRLPENTFPEKGMLNLNAAKELSVNNNTAHDTQLVSGQTYLYAITANYTDPTTPTKQRQSVPVYHQAIPQLHLTAVDDLHVYCCQQHLTLTWTAPTRGDVIFLLLPIEQSLKPDLVPLEALADKQKLDLLAVQPANTNVEQPEYFDTTPLSLHRALAVVNASEEELKTLHVIPCTVYKTTVLAGKACPLVSAPEVSHIESHVQTGSVELTWNWPETIQETLVVWSDKKNSHNTLVKDSTRRHCTRQEYNTTNNFHAEQSNATRMYITIFCRIPYFSCYSKGIQHVVGLGHAETVCYSVYHKGFFQKYPAGIILHSETVTELHDLVLCAKEQTVPLTPHDGTTLANIKNITFTNGQALIPLSANHCPKNHFVRLFYSQEARFTDVRLMPARLELLKL